VQICPEKPAIICRRAGVVFITIAAVYAFALMLIYGIDISSQIEHQGELTQEALSSKVSGVTEFMCAVDNQHVNGREQYEREPRA
jgi:hypothetical protein